MACRTRSEMFTRVVCHDLAAMRSFSFKCTTLFTVLIVFLSDLWEGPSAVSALFHVSQSSALLRFKQGLDLLPGKLTSWQKESDCCQWEGVACDNITASVTTIRLSNVTSQFDNTISSIDPSLFQLRHLQLLDLSINDFRGRIPKGLAEFTRLTHLDLSYCQFFGEIPLEISQMIQLISFNVSHNSDLQLGHPNLERFVKGLSNLQDFRLDYVNISMSGKDVSLVLSSQLPRLQTLSLWMCGIQGPMDESLVGLSSLSYLDLSWNCLTNVSEFLINFTSLRVLKLANCSLEGNFPSSILFLPQLEEVDISINRRLVIDIQLDTHVKSSKILSLDVSFTKQMSSNLFVLSHLTKLTHLRMESSGLTASFPSSWQSSRISVMDLSDNNIFGPIPEYFNSFSNLTYLDLSYNLLNGSIPSELPNLPNLSLLDLSNNRLSGCLPNFSKSNLNLEHIFLGNNNLSGDITLSVRKLPNLQSLGLSRNSLSGNLNISLFSGMKNLFSLDLSYNARLTVETSNTSHADNSDMIVPPFVELYLSDCGIKTFPSFLYKLRQLRMLDLAHNEIRGRVPSWLWSRNLEGFTISDNQIEGIDWPSNNTELTDSSLQYLNVSHNQIIGQIPPFIYNFTALLVVDASNNDMEGAIPDCFSKHNFRAPILLNLNSNSLSGKIPKSLSNCSELQALDLGNNQLNDTFPFWLGSLSKLRILNLRSNHLWGHINTPSSQPTFPSLQILDISANLFSGPLPVQLFKSLDSMKVFRSGSEPSFIQADVSIFLGIIYAAAIQRIKGNEVVIRKVLETMTIIDLSNNFFTGGVPEEIGELWGLRQLNISSNNLSGIIPTSLGNLSQLESLDLSVNHIFGSIPEQLSELTFLAVLNLSFNELQGSIPQGKQFNTFEESSFIGNPKLCGPQVKKQCHVGGDVNRTYKQGFGGDKGNNQVWEYGAATVGFLVGLAILALPILFIKRVANFYWNQIDRVVVYIFNIYYFMFGRGHNKLSPDGASSKSVPCTRLP